jgi:phosphotransferase system enzyme I (PtsI)
MKGIGGSPGYALGPVYIKKAFKEPEKYTIENIEAALEALDKALIEADKVITNLMDKTRLEMGESESEVFKAHLMMLHDRELLKPIKEKIKIEKLNPAYAVLEVRNQWTAIFDAMDDAYMKERGADVKDVCDRLMKELMGIKDMDELSTEYPVILVAHDLTPSDTASIKKGTVVGFVTEVGGKTSHSAIMARSLEIPAVLGVEGILNQIKNGEILTLDGFNGRLDLNPCKDLIQNFEEKRRVFEEEKERLKAYIHKKSITLDGHVVEIACNIGQAEEVENVLSKGAEGIGLFRSEFLYMDRNDMPSEEEQFQAYKHVLSKMKEKPVVIRTLDIGGDKQIPYMDFPKEDNPFLGFRAIRYCLENQDIFKIQLRALLRASVFGNLSIMFPMISNIQEVRKAKIIIESVKESLAEENIAYGDFKVGIMIEIPAAALIADQLAKEVDFFSIGTNDLIQYTTAVDRMNQKISDLYSPYHPGLLKLIQMVIDGGRRNNVWVGMCGEVAGNEKLIPLLLAMGLQEFSMSPGSVLKARKLISELNYQELKPLVSQVLEASDSVEVLKLLDEKFAPKTL